ncbi:MAG: VWA domain-containing protein, partial [Verrucomicrobiales bacterium]
MLERSKHFDRYDVAQLAVDARDIAQVARAQDSEKIGRLSRPASSLESLAQVDSDSKNGKESPATWGRFGNVAAWREPEVAEKAVAHDSFFVDPGSSDGWEQGISLAKKPQIVTDEGRSVASFAVTSEPSQLNFVADGGMTPAINGALNNDPSSPQQWGAKTDAALPSPALRSPRGSASPEAAATLEYNAGTAGTDRLASAAVTAPVAYGEEFVEFDQTIPQPEALGEIAQVETDSASDEGFVSGGTKAYYKMPAGGRRFRAKTAPTDPPSPPTEDLALDLVEQIRPAGDSEAKREAVTKEQLAHTFEDQSRPAIGLGMEVTPPPAPEPIAELFATVPDPPVYAGGVAVPVDESARGFVSASGVATGFSMLDKFAAPETSSTSPASSDDPFSSEAEGMDLAEVNSLRLQSQIYSEGEHGDVVAGISGGGFGGGGIGGGGGRVGPQQESQQALGQEVAQQRALYDHFARDFGKDGAETAAGTPFVSTITADFGWDSQPGLVTSLREASTEEEPTAMHWAMPAPVERATRLAGDRVTQEADAGVAIQPGFGASIPGSESILSRRLVEAEISQYGSEQDEAKLVEVLKSTKELAKADQFSVSTNGKVRGLGTLSLGDDERSREHLAPFGDSLADAGNVDGTVRMLSLAGQIDGEDNSATVEQRLAAALQTEESEEEEKEVTRGGQVNTRFAADTSYDRKLALPEVNGRWEAGDAILGLSDAAAVASGGSEVAEANRPEGTESSWYDFDVDTPGKEVTGLAARNLIAGEGQDGLDIAGAVEIEELREKKFADFTGANFSRSSRSTATVAEPVTGAIVVDSKREEAVAEAQPLIEESLTVANERVSALRSETRKQSSDKSGEQAQLGKLAASKSKRAKVKPDLSLETLTSAEPFSTFSLNVSDVSFKLAKTALLENNSFPDSTKVRVEEFVNAFDYGDPSPSLNEKVACNIDQSAHPFLQQRNLMRISMQTAAEGRAASQPLRLTILLDKSGSMERADREESVLRTMQALSTHLGPADTITAVAFARQPHLIADQLSGDRAEELVGLVAATPSEGGTNLEEALALADT